MPLPPPTVDTDATIRDYLEAFAARDVDRCTSLYAEDGVVVFQFSRYGGQAAIASWHRERFEANLRVQRIDDVNAEDGTVTVDAVVESDRLRKWRLDSLSVRLRFALEAGKIRELACDMRATPW
jgi:hypothetical protein